LWPDNIYAPPRGSFERPVIQPLTDPDASPTKTVAINCDWLPYVRGALQQLVLQATWNNIEGGLDITQARAMTLISMFEECEGAAPPFACPYDFVHAGSGAPFVPTAPGPFVGPRAQFIPTIGWNSTSDAFSDNSQTWQLVDIFWALPEDADIGIVQCVYGNYVAGDNYSGTADSDTQGIFLYHTGSVVASDTWLRPSLSSSGTKTHDFGGVTADLIRVLFIAGITGGVTTAPGNITILEVEVTGHASGFACP
jgi:hypothetical protein